MVQGSLFCAFTIDACAAKGSASREAAPNAASVSCGKAGVVFFDVDHTGALGDDSEVVANGDDCPEKAWNAEEGFAYDDTIVSSASRTVNPRLPERTATRGAVLCHSAEGVGEYSGDDAATAALGEAGGVRGCSSSVRGKTMGGWI